MIPRELIRKIRRIEIRTNRMVNDVLAGEYHSVFKGRGVEFEEVREYMHGDDIRTIDWNVTARMGSPYVKRYREERELTVMLAVDASSSSLFGTALAGGVPVALSTFSTTGELDYLLKASQVSLLIHEARVLKKDFGAMLRELEPDLARAPVGTGPSEAPRYARPAVAAPPAAPDARTLRKL